MDINARVKELLDRTLPMEEKVASAAGEDHGAVELSKEALELSARLEKIAQLPFLSSFEAARRATPRSVDASNKGWGDVIAHKAKAPPAFVDAMSTAKLAGEGVTQSERLRQALIGQLRSAGVSTGAEVAHEVAAPPVISESSVVNDIAKVASDLRMYAEKVAALESRCDAAEEEAEKARREAAAREIAKTAADRGYIGDEDADDYARDLLEGDTDLEEIQAKVASAPFRIGLGTGSSRVDTTSIEQTGENRLLNRLSRNAR